MDELEKILLTSSLTILGGVVVYTVGQVISKFFIEPIHRQGEIIGDIADALVYYADVYSNPGLAGMEEAQQALRRLASSLRSRSYMIRWYKLWEILRLVPKLSSVGEASSNLIGLSNSVGPHGDGMRNSDRADKIRTLLGIPTGETLIT